VIAGQRAWQSEGVHATPPPAPPHVTVSQPLQATVGGTTSFLGQFSAVDSVELRAQVGGQLTVISFRDGQIVGRATGFRDRLAPFQIRLIKRWRNCAPLRPDRRSPGSRHGASS
jgi:hypothetical protein